MLLRPGRLMTSGAAGAASWISTYTGAEANVMAVDFSTLAMIIKDSVTPANNYNGSPASKLTYTAPSAKWIRGADGLFSSASTMRTEFDASGTALGVRIEEARTNRVLWNRDLTNAVWTKTNATVAKNVTGIDGIGNSASRITFDADNGTVLQSITSASAARITSAFVYRISGSGAIRMTQDNGGTWTAISPTASFARFAVPSATVTNPIVGFQGATAGDVIGVDFVQEETGAFTTSPISTTTATITRAADVITMATSLAPAIGSDVTLYAEALPTNQLQTSARLMFQSDDGTVGNRIMLSLRAALDDLDVRVDRASVNQLLVNVGSISATVMNKVALGVATNDANCYQSGASIATDASCIIPSGQTTWRFGNHAASVGPLNGWLKRVLYVPRRMSNTELGNITT